MNSLRDLSDRGEVVRDPYGRWCLAEFNATYSRAQAVSDAAQSRAQTTPLVLRAIPAFCSQLALPAEDSRDESPRDNSALPSASWQARLDYYAATQRQDPRGRVEEFEERHGTAWQIFQTRGRWWSGAAITISIQDLPDGFRQGLVRRSVRTAALGWPTCIFQGAKGTSCVPALLFPASWAIAQESLVLSVEEMPPTLNPAWLKIIRRHASLSEPQLQDRLFPEGEDAGLDEVAPRLANLVATLGGSGLAPGRLAGTLMLEGNIVQNAAAMFLPEDETFTKGVAADLETLRDWAPERRAGTALSALIEPAGAMEAPPSADCRLLPESDLTPNQIQAVADAIAGPLTVIQGPPGTGKTSVIVSILTSALASGRTVLLAARNHQAIDEVERRLAKVVPDVPFFVRARDAEGERDVSFLDALREIGQGPTRDIVTVADYEAGRRTLAELAARFENERKAAADLAQWHSQLCEIAERIAARTSEGGNGQPVPPIARLLARLIEQFARLIGRRRKLSSDVPAIVSSGQLAAWAEELKAKLATAPPTPGARRVREIADELRQNLPKLLKWRVLPDEETRKAISGVVKALEFEGRSPLKRMAEQDARAVLAHRPIWAVSTLSVPARIPLIARLFDLVIFDEASQCDIASALPLLARAKSAAIVGDPMQLSFIPKLGRSAEHALMDAAGLPREGRAHWAQSINSLFDFAERQNGTKRRFLNDQFRSAPDIVDYLNGDFYDGRLEPRREDEDFDPPAGYKPGLTWEDAIGTPVRKDGGTINQAEATRIAEIVQRLAISFGGSIGIISPFNAQVGEIERVIRAELPSAVIDQAGLRFGTVDRFQGGEVDVVLFSLVVGPAAPQSARLFLQRERRRLNVAISRARALCIVVGDLAYARNCGIKHIEYLANRATAPRSVARPDRFDSSWERRLDVAMRARGLEPIPQFPVGTKFLDFAIDPHGRKINVEVDGKRWHTDAAGNRKVQDILRDRELEARGWTVLRFWVHELINDMEGCLDRIERQIRAS